MISKVLETVEKYNMLNGTKKVVVGFSGGADSTALVHFLHFFLSDCGKKFQVKAVHINHCLRGEEALRDENFAKAFCEKNGIEILVKKVDINKIANENKIGLEEAGRNARYKIFESLCCESAAKIATAHTLSDTCETLLLNLARGTSLKGLCAIPPKRGKIIRPLINVTRAEIEKYCSDHNLDYIDDSSNFETIYTRNKIRLNVIPIFKKINPRFESAIARTLLSIEEDEKYLESESEKYFQDIKIKNGYDAIKLQKLPNSLKRRVLVKILKSKIDKLIEQKYVDLLEKLLLSSSKVILPGNLEAYCENNIFKIAQKNSQNTPNWEYPLSKSNLLTEIKTNIIIKVAPFLEYNKAAEKYGKNNILDFEKIPKKCVMRNRREGDFFKLPKRNITKSMKKLMNELKISRNIRNSIPMIAFGSEIIWAGGIGVSEKYIPNKNTQQIAIIVNNKL